MAAEAVVVVVLVAVDAEDEKDLSEESREQEKKRKRGRGGEREREKDGETGDAATKDNSCSAGGDVNFCAVGQCYCRRREASRDKTLSDFTSGSAGPPRDPSPPPSPPALSSSRYAKLPRASCVSSRLSSCLPPSTGPIPMPIPGREGPDPRRFRERIYISRNRPNFYKSL